ncbi:hypothetical protein Bca101_053418 [Brassica carinata]
MRRGSSSSYNVVMMNMAYNISLLRLIKISSAVVSSLASTVSVPIAVYFFTLPLPYLGVASSLPTEFEYLRSSHRESIKNSIGLNSS